jgi:hypothetical protein
MYVIIRKESSKITKMFYGINTCTYLDLSVK